MRAIKLRGSERAGPQAAIKRWAKQSAAGAHEGQAVEVSP